MVGTAEKKNHKKINMLNTCPPQTHMRIEQWSMHKKSARASERQQFENQLTGKVQQLQILHSSSHSKRTSHAHKHTLCVLRIYMVYSGARDPALSSADPKMFDEAADMS